AWQWTVQHPDEAVEIVARVDPLIDQELERQRLQLALETNIMTPYVMEHGLGTVDPARLASSIEQLATALKLERTPDVADIWTDQFLPAMELRKLGG
ncbi:MAG TPA: hypothetical protein VFG43_06745, partial [Geminicoccaceae bacterium]|nr:hypothetical protein [Geminicoccaceae bacterium]